MVEFFQQFVLLFGKTKNPKSAASTPDFILLQTEIGQQNIIKN
jgi:hypothetical protein